jgi:branched-chain amino acid transport system permease protein
MALIAERLVLYFGSFTGGESGLLGVTQISSFLGVTQIPNSITTEYYISLIFFGLVFIILYRMTRSPLGLIFTSISGDEIATASTGINVTKIKTFAFVFSSIVAGFAGAMFGHSIAGGVSPSHVITLAINIEIIVAALVGGIGTITGAGIGGILYTYIYKVSEGIRTQVPLTNIQFPEVQNIVFWSAILLFIFFYQKGIIQIFKDIRNKLGNKSTMNGRGDNNDG